MIKQEFTLDDKWLVRVMYSLGQDDTMEAMKALHELKCPRKNAIQAYSVISSGINKGFTYTNHLSSSVNSCLIIFYPSKSHPSQ